MKNRKRNFLDTSLDSGMQGELILHFTGGERTNPAKESVEEIYLRIFRELRPRTPPPLVQIHYKRFVNVNSSIRLSDGLLEVKISDLLESAPATVAEALARILLGKLLRHPASAESVRKYRSYLNRKEIRNRIELLRQVRGRKHLSGPVGKHFNLESIFECLNQRFFAGLLARPELGWSLGRSRAILGHFDPSHNAIIISRIFDEASTPPLAVEYVMFHEMLHLKHPVDHSGIRRCVHTPAFRQAEKQFPQLHEAKEMLKRLR